MTARHESTRSAFIDALLQAGSIPNSDIVVVAADSHSRYGDFVKRFPERSFNVGIAEQTMIGVAAGLALIGKTVVTTAYANFLTFRALEQIRVDIAAEKLNVKLVGTDTGFAAAWSGYTHLALEDMAAIRALPHIVIVDPADAREAFEATCAILEYRGPVYLRLRGRQEEPSLPVYAGPFRIGEGKVLMEGRDVLLIACGSAVYESLKAAQLLKETGRTATVVDMATVKPLDVSLLLELASSIPRVVTVENHNITGGLGTAVAELLAEKALGTRLLRLGLRNRFGTAGSEEMLKKEFRLDAEGIATSVKEFLDGGNKDENYYRRRPPGI
ncbi:Thiamin diphosphate-binding fold [Moorella glycerini]|uniref:1-deoxy-D-xylulose-5-phosphate synthase n=1 Tax=Neomoorella stamsii TaxID=1266720 RepID=A0A9X7J598_9FIRM|nr:MULTISPECIES: transketolase C-terminal domain-containing protein [Moorella]PRR77513.1 1-deoxy-D-xylulose-5-phosphate synthase [Moorella stamsii]CEP68262.1 Thiamin diphosphate-binding fold [Moorella glycerini]